MLRNRPSVGNGSEAQDHSNGRRLSYAVLDTATDDVVFDNYDAPPRNP